MDIFDRLSEEIEKAGFEIDKGDVFRIRYTCTTIDSFASPNSLDDISIQISDDGLITVIIVTDGFTVFNREQKTLSNLLSGVDKINIHFVSIEEIRISFLFDTAAKRR